MANISPPKYVRRVLVTLQARGHLAYLVGGCVRDIILGVRPNDWDVCTSALPAQVLEIFPGARPTGIKHGTVTVYISSRAVEVTTFRADGSYADHRHPDAVRFVGELTADLSRRDFTMNAIALPPDGLVADPFGGVEDIHNRLIRCVGVPSARFDEDALRMFRALRFSARLGFAIEENTMAAIREKAPLAAALAAERVRDELEKLIMTPAPETVHTLIALGLLDTYIIRRAEAAAPFARIARLPKKALARWGGLCAALIDAEAIENAEAFLSALRLDGRTIRIVSQAMRLMRAAPPADRAAWKRMLSEYGVDSVLCAAQCRDALYGGQSVRTLKAILKSGECFSIRHLAVSGDDLLALGLRGRELGEMLSFLLDYVIEYPENNRRELLISIARGTEE